MLDAEATLIHDAISRFVYFETCSKWADLSTDAVLTTPQVEVILRGHYGFEGTHIAAQFIAKGGASCRNDISDFTRASAAGGQIIDFDQVPMLWLFGRGWKKQFWLRNYDFDDGTRVLLALLRLHTGQHLYGPGYVSDMPLPPLNKE